MITLFYFLSVDLGRRLAYPMPILFEDSLYSIEGFRFSIFPVRLCANIFVAWRCFSFGERGSLALRYVERVCYSTKGFLSHTGRKN